MAAVSLVKMLGRRGRLRQVIQSLQDGAECAVSIQDAAGELLIGPAADAGAERFPVAYEGQTIGWVAGGRDPAGIAALLAYAAEQEGEKKTLANELIERYRELNLLYHLSDHMAASPHPEAIASVGLDEVMRMIPAQAGIILLSQEEKASFETAAACGIPYHLTSTRGIIERVLQTGKAELANGVAGEEYFEEAKGQLISAACAPLKTEKRVLGVLILAGSAERNFTAGELKLLNTIAMQIAPAIEVTRLYQVAIEKARYEQEMRMAKEVQESLLPAEMPKLPGWSFDRRWRPVREVSGDFYDFISEGSQLGLVIADVTDKGMPASLFMVFVRSALRASLEQSDTPAGAIIRTNHLICHESHNGLFTTLFYARLEPETGQVTYVNAGHPSALLYHASQDAVELLRRTGLPLGIEVDSAYQEAAAQLAPGDFLLFFTDGLTEAANPAGKEFSFERVRQVIYDHRAAPPRKILDALEQALDDYTGKGKIADDVTLMIIKRETS